MTQRALSYRRLRAVLVLQETEVGGLARKLSVTSQHLWHVVTGKRRGSEEMLRGIRGAIGEAAWRFVAGQTDTLSDKARSCAGR